MIRLVCATQRREADFWTNTLLGRSLNFYRQYASRFELRLFSENQRGLPAVYNQALAEAHKSTPRIMVFVHDDIHFLDLFWPESILEGLTQFDMIGTLGCKRHYQNQLSWVHVWQGSEIVNPKRQDVSGSVTHFSRGEVDKGIVETDRVRPDHFAPFGADLYFSHFGPSGQQVVLLDGMLMACHSNTLFANDIQFDERFDFHFYDMDICRQFEAKGLRMGTWAVSVLHGSHGSYGEAFLKAYPAYAEKWPFAAAPA